MKMGESQPTTHNVLRRLQSGKLESLGLLPWSSNYAFLVKVAPDSDKAGRQDDDGDDGDALLAVYKPRRGEAPLWDFPEGTLCLRELAAYLVSVSLG
ncbi:MAG: hypothetical protein ACUVR3_14100, partial [Candidatus Roseilinea sp.]